FSFPATATPEISTLSLHDALPISVRFQRVLEFPFGPGHRLARQRSRELVDRQRHAESRPEDDDHDVGLARRRDLFLEVVRGDQRSEEHTSELQSLTNLVCRLLLEK